MSVPANDVHAAQAFIETVEVHRAAQRDHRDRGQRDQARQSPTLVSGPARRHREYPGQHGADIAAEIDQHRAQCADVDRNIERQSLIRPARKPRHDDEVGG